jgi:hypothetical protein
MTRRIWSGSCAAIAFGLAVGLAAQSQPTSQDRSSQDVTVTGCIQRATESPTGTSGTAGAKDVHFLLKNTTSTASSSTESAPAASSTAVASEYRLDADDVKLTPHVGHKVEITGTIEPPMSTAAPESASASKMNAPKLKVNNVRMIAATCS